MVWTIREFIKRIEDMGYDVKHVEFGKFEVRKFGRAKSRLFEYYKLSYNESDLLPFSPLCQALD